jgi:hypothetical protein
MIKMVAEEMQARKSSKHDDFQRLDHRLLYEEAKVSF